jgi:hypothetical protein
MFASSSASAPRNATNVNSPKIISAHEPIDIGDQYLNIGLKVWLSISMCQNRSGLPRSIVNSRPLTSTHGNAT